MRYKAIPTLIFLLLNLAFLTSVYAQSPRREKDSGFVTFTLDGERIFPGAYWKQAMAERRKAVQSSQGKAAKGDNNNEDGWNYLKWGMRIKEAIDLVNKNEGITLEDQGDFALDEYLRMQGIVRDALERENTTFHPRDSKYRIIEDKISGRYKDCISFNKEGKEWDKNNIDYGLCHKYFFESFAGAGADWAIKLFFIEKRLAAITLDIDLGKDYKKDAQDILGKLKGKYPKGQIITSKDKANPSYFYYYTNNFFIITDCAERDEIVYYIDPLHFEIMLRELLLEDKKKEEERQKNINRKVF